jgi:hypothetical protein
MLIMVNRTICFLEFHVPAAPVIIWLTLSCAIFSLDIENRIFGQFILLTVIKAKAYGGDKR